MIERTLQPHLQRLFERYPVVTITGPRLLRHGRKGNLVMSSKDWAGVHGVNALINGEPLLAP